MTSKKFKKLLKMVTILLAAILLAWWIGIVEHPVFLFITGFYIVSSAIYLVFSKE